jgi:hypothetical protein
MESSLTAADALVRLEEPFAPKDVKWLVAATSRDSRKGRVTPYADPRAYTDRPNQIFTASGGTRGYLMIGTALSYMPALEPVINFIPAN